MSNINRIVFCLFFLLFAGVVFAESEGGALFRQNKPEEAIPILERDIAAGTAEAEDYNFLGLSYYQTGDWEKSVAAFEAGLLVSGTNKRILAFNAGNSCYGAGEFEKAEEYYSLAIIADSTFKEAILNRANTKFRLDKLSEAVEDYELFERTAPDDENIPLVQEMILLLRAEMRKREENARLEAELERRRREKDKDIVENGEAPKDETISADENTSEIVEDDSLPEPETPAPDDSKENSSEIIEDDSIPETPTADDEKAGEDLQDVQPEIIADEIPDESADAGAEGEAAGDVGAAEIVPEKIEDDWLSLPDELPLPSSADTSGESAADSGESVPAERFEMEMPE